MISMVSGGPWNVEDHLLILQPWQEHIQHFSDDCFLVKFWVQIWVLSTELYSERMGRKLLGYLKNCSVMQLRQQWNSKSKFYHCRIKINIMCPLWRYLWSGEPGEE